MRDSQGDEDHEDASADAAFPRLAGRDAGEEFVLAQERATDMIVAGTGTWV